jgi:tRNA1(Val) A37 N6-methylase TrmN6
MKGFVPTPPLLVDTMIEKLFRNRPPTRNDRLLDPGCGTGAFIQGVVRWCQGNSTEIPRIVGVESNPIHFSEAKRSVGHVHQVELRLADFLEPSPERYDYIVGNPPYVSITGLSVEERTRYRERYFTARGRFDLYLLFFEQALRLLKSGGRLVFVTPEKFLYVETADVLRRQLASLTVEEIDLIEESAFGDLVTYPTITTIAGKNGTRKTRVRLRDGTTRSISLARSGLSWLPQMRGGNHSEFGPTLSDACLRISCGVATGADGIYMVDDEKLPQELQDFAFRTISGRRITPGERIQTKQSMLVPYAPTGALLSESALGALGDYLRVPFRRERLLQRTCVSHKPWYAFHENPPLNHILRPKILCKDIGHRPWFVVEESGDIIPRHSVYYLVPQDASRIHELCDYLNSEEACKWLITHCQRAANGFVRLQSHILKKLPLPERFLDQHSLASGKDERVSYDNADETAIMSAVPVGARRGGF